MATNNTLTRYQPTTGITRLPDLMDRLFRESFVMPGAIDGNLRGRTTLPLNLVETQDGYVMYAALPGLDSENLEIQVVGREITIKGKVDIKTPEGSNWIWQGIPAGEFHETVTLPVEVDSSNTEAGYENGILSITLPKAAHLKPKTIKVNAR